MEGEPVSAGSPSTLFTMLTLDELRDDASLDTVVVAFTDMQGRLLGKRLHRDFFLEHGSELVEGQHREKAEGEPASRLPPAAQCRSGPSSTSDGTSSICASSPPAMCAGAPWRVSYTHLTLPTNREV